MKPRLTRLRDMLDGELRRWAGVRCADERPGARDGWRSDRAV